MIRAIDKSSIQKICSGQVVVDLATAVKEMVENSLDCGATSVEVKLRDMGASYIEVSDNGSGIDPSNYDGIARKHFTSKLKDFDDIFSVSSFGFRGEALNALCELSGSFSITTKQAQQPVGACLQFDRNGGLLSQSVAARTNGTSVMVENLFDKLPVRRKDFVKSIKKHFQKMVRVVQSYALISLGVKIIVTNVTTSLTAGAGTPVGSRQTVFATQSGGKLTDNVSILFGAKFASSLLPIEFSVQLGKQTKLHTCEPPTANHQDEEEEVTKTRSEIEFADFVAHADTDGGGAVDDVPVTQQDSPPSSPVSTGNTPTRSEERKVEAPPASEAPPPVTEKCTVRGLVSKVGLGVGRSDNDRQFTFCNGRPVDLPRFAKALNEIWRKYEMKQKPAFVLDILVPAGYFDVNLAPDKREVLIVQEALILEQLREVVDALYLPVRQTMPLNQGMACGTANPTWAAMFSSHASSESSPAEVAPTTRNLIQSALADYLVATPAAPLTACSPAASQMDMGSQEQSWAQSEDVLFEATGMSQGSTASVYPAHSLPVSASASASVPTTHSASSNRSNAVVWLSELESERLPCSPAKRARIGEAQLAALSPLAPTSTCPPPSSSSASQQTLSRDASQVTPSASASASAGTLLRARTEEGTVPNAQHVSLVNIEEEVEYVAKTKLWEFDAAAALNEFVQRKKVRRTAPAAITGTPQRDGKDANNQRNTDEEDAFNIATGTLGTDEDEPEAALSSSGKNANKERMQARILHKKDFPRMRVIGQFNLGFIIAEVDGDLYILDQHACDEKYRFELLQRTTQIHQQPLIHPLSVETSAALELVVADHLDTFARNGFKLTVDLAAPTGSRVKLHAVPFSKSVRFGVDDVNELASMISEHHRGGDDSSSAGDATTQRTSKAYLMLKNDSLANDSQRSTGTTTDTDSGANHSSVDGSSSSGSREETFRLPKLVAMYASRACRSAIMIGTALHDRDMLRVVGRLEDVEQPWNCPHGRPTLRHLVDLTPLREHSSHREPELPAVRLFATQMN